MTGPAFGYSYALRGSVHRCNPGLRDWAGTDKAESTRSGGYEQSNKYDCIWGTRVPFPILYAVDVPDARILAYIKPTNEFIRIDCAIPGPTLSVASKAFTPTDPTEYNSKAALGISASDSHDTLNYFFAYLYASGGTSYIRVKKIAWDKSANTITESMVSEFNISTNTVVLQCKKVIGDIGYVGLIEYTDGSATTFYIHIITVNMGTSSASISMVYDSSTNGYEFHTNPAAPSFNTFLWFVNGGGQLHWFAPLVRAGIDLCMVIDGVENTVATGESGTFADWFADCPGPNATGSGQYAEYNQQDFLYNCVFKNFYGVGSEYSVWLRSDLTPDIEIDVTPPAIQVNVAPLISANDNFFPQFVFNRADKRIYPINVTDGTLGTVVALPTGVSAIRYVFPALDIYDNSVYCYCLMTDTSYKLLKLSSANFSTILASYPLALTQPTFDTTPGGELRGNWLIRFDPFIPTAQWRVAYLANEADAISNDVQMIVEQN